MDGKNIFRTKADDLIMSFLSGNSSLPDDENLLDWVNQSEDNKAYFLKRQKIWLGAGQDCNAEQVNTEKAFEKVILASGLDSKVPEKKTLPLSFRISGIAAAVLLVFSLGSILSYFIFRPSVDEDSVCLVHAPKGSQAMTVLPDGSEVWLNAGSSLRFNNTSNFKESREVRLTGEAFFKVITNKKNPFVVKTKGLDIKALGTEFNVKAYPEEKIVEATLVEGIVRIEGRDQNLKRVDITLAPRQKAVCHTGEGLIVSSEKADQSSLSSAYADKLENADNPAERVSKSIISSNVKTDLYTSWKDERWIIEGMEIDQLAVLIERKYNVSIQIDSEELKAYTFTGTFQSETLEQAMHVLKLSAPLNYKIGKGRVELALDPLLKDRYDKFPEGSSVSSD